ncbi:hypothetical protein BCV69DRAFT_97747 [Microstroma glucosiphilum]|uniref:SEC7 domain-containing protein n=1 Tax=Pseudomicrostroma glucosiphilum TaxID=1684307 RepID=A0A316UFW0_9BASI|nr:hypothetical protein BCV69DRAFT_97747 [Pseudomicrostroma glucosiphilum]PWN22793.1 hypothetical protein BCV69DRAFT_97747 [Pseudomicrostroma glucosiphilum]
MFALHKAFEQSTKSVQDAAQAERQRRTQLSQQSGATRLATSSPAGGLLTPQAGELQLSSPASHLTAKPLPRSSSMLAVDVSSLSLQDPPQSPSTLRSPNGLRPPGPAPTSQLPAVPPGSGSSPLSSSSRVPSLRRPFSPAMMQQQRYGVQRTDGSLVTPTSLSEASASPSRLSSTQSPPDLLSQRTGSQAAETREDVFAGSSSHATSPSETRSRSPMPSSSRLQVPSYDEDGPQRSASPLSFRRGSRTGDSEILQDSSSRPSSPAEPRPSFSSGSRFRLFGRKKRDESPHAGSDASRLESGARDDSPDWVGRGKGDSQEGGVSRPSQDSRGRPSTSSLSRSPLNGNEGRQAAAAMLPSGGGMGRSSLSHSTDSHAEGSHHAGLDSKDRRSPAGNAGAAGAASLEVPHSSTDSGASARRFSFGFLSSAIHSGRSPNSGSTDSNAFDPSDLNSAPPAVNRSESRHLPEPVQGAASNDAPPADSSKAFNTSFAESSGRAAPPLTPSRLSFFGGGNSSGPQVAAMASPGATTPLSASNFEAQLGRQPETNPSLPTDARSSPDIQQPGSRAAPSKVLHSFRSRSSNNLRMFGRSATKPSEPSPAQGRERAPANSIDGGSSRQQRGLGDGSRLAVPNATLSWAAAPLAVAPPRPNSSTTSSQSSSRMGRVFSKRRPATGPDSLSEQDLAIDGGSNSRISPAVSRSSLAVEDGSAPGMSARLRSASTASSVVLPGGLPTTPGPQTGDKSKLSASGGAAGLFGSSSDSRPRSASKPTRSLFGGSSGNNGGSTWLTPRKKTVPEFDMVSPMPKLERNNSDFAAITASRSRPGDLSDVPEQSQALNDPQPEEKLKPSRYPPLDRESPQKYCDRLERTISPGDVVTVLANSGDPFYVEALRCHMRKFLFVGNPLDIALRKMLMEVCLPKETQQIDRVMEAFAQRYNECNEGLFASADQPYILAFSLMMLHTDAFNRNAKNKMSKADYVRNSSSSGVAQDVLEYLYDNLTFTQFVYTNEVDSGSPTEPSGIRSAPAASASSGFLTRGANGAPSSARDKNGKIDVYYLIKQGRLSEFRPWIEHLIPEDDPYSWTGTEGNLDVAFLTETYMASPSIEISTQRRPSLMTTSAGPAPTVDYNGALDSDPSVTLRIFKVGIINRKDDVAEKGKRTSRKWKSCGVILSSSQLLFFRDLVWIDALKAQMAEQVAAASPEERKLGIVITPRIRDLKPDDVLSLSDALAISDDTYDKHDNVFRLINQQGNNQLEYLFQAKSEDAMNDWIAAINFCACFRAAGLRVTELDAAVFDDPYGEELQRDGMYNGFGPSASPQEQRATSQPLYSTTGQSMPSELMLSRMAARRQEMLPRLRGISKAHKDHAAELAELLRLAKHFAIMTPFQRATKDRIEAASVPLAARIRQLRVLVAKFESRQYILASELRAAEEHEKKWTGKHSGAKFGNWNFSPGRKFSVGEIGGNTFPPTSPQSQRAVSGGHPGSRIVQERKASWRSQASSELDSVGPISPILDPLTEDVAVHGMPLRPIVSPSASLGGGAGSAPRAGIASFAPGSYDSDYAASITSVASRSRVGRRRSSGNNPVRRKGSDVRGGDIAESWEATKAFRDPDRITIAQLPDLSTIELVTRKKALHRAALDNANAQGGDDLDAILNTPSSSRKNRKASEGSASGLTRGGRMRSGSVSNSISSGSGSASLPQAPLDPPAFMMSWGT